MHRARTNITISKFVLVIILAPLVTLLTATPAYAMHISEGILPLPWALFWYVVAIPFVIKGTIAMRKNSRNIPAFMPFVGMVSAAVFIISALPIPVPVAGTCSHPAGTGLAAMLIGPFPTIVSASIALLIQALFLAHGGISTWGADVVSMGVVGAISGYITYKVSVKLKLPLTVAAFLTGVVSDWATYTTTSLELALGLSNRQSFLALFKAIFIAFIPTQLPIGILEGFAAAGLFAFVLKRRPDIFIALGIITESQIVVKGGEHENPAFQTD
ncbi:MAG TPA: energy-coupling factor ABC transporter permease [Candidatus Aquicultor sp.]|jgi:cobalt/nickel transport system permease protein